MFCNQLAESVANVVLLGTGNSGKSTIFKSIIKAEKGFWSLAERFESQEIILDNVLNSIGDVLDAMSHTVGDGTRYEDMILSHMMESISALAHDPVSVKEKFTLAAWADLEAWVNHPSVQRSIERRPRYWLTDAAP
jgi:ABC-type molybdenum transport system ATPase subunit/photorepair protein PhrA